MRTRCRPAAIAKSLLAASLSLAIPGCITTALWDNANDHGCPKPAAVALTPVTIALDVALIGGWIYLASECGGHVSGSPQFDCCQDDPCHRR